MQGPSHPGPGACRQSTDTVIPSGGRAPHSCVIEGRVVPSDAMEETKVILRSRGTYHNCPTGMDGRQLFDEWAPANPNRRGEVGQDLLPFGATDGSSRVAVALEGELS